MTDLDTSIPTLDPEAPGRYLAVELVARIPGDVSTEEFERRLREAVGCTGATCDGIEADCPVIMVGTMAVRGDPDAALHWLRGEHAPTPWAYARVCEALEKAKRERDELAAALVELRPEPA